MAHFDDERTLDVRLTKGEIRARRAELTRDERVSLRATTSDWLEIEVRSDGDTEWARTLIREAVAANLHQ